MIYADLHCDTLTAFPNLRTATGQVSLPTLAAAGCRLMCFAAFLRREEGNLCARAVAYADRLAAEAEANADLAVRVLKAADLHAAASTGKVGMLYTIEEGDAVEGDPDKLRALYAKGLRMMSLTWNHPNLLGYPNVDASRIDELGPKVLYMPNDRPLTPLGRDMVAAMNDLGVIVDVSHLGDGGFWDALDVSDSPIVASHSNARAVCPVSRNLTDDMIAALARKGGVMGLNFCPDFLCNAQEDVLSWAVRHAVHIWQVGGEDVLAVGSDFDGTVTRAPLSTCADVPALYHALCAAMPARVVDKMMWANFARVFEAVCG